MAGGAVPPPARGLVKPGAAAGPGVSGEATGTENRHHLPADFEAAARRRSAVPAAWLLCRPPGGGVTSAGTFPHPTPARLLSVHSLSPHR